MGRFTKMVYTRCHRKIYHFQEVLTSLKVSTVYKDWDYFLAVQMHIVLDLGQPFLQRKSPFHFCSELANEISN